MAPILPGLSDRPEQLEAVVRAAREAGARSIWASVVHLRPGLREHYLEALARDWPDEVARYEQLFATGRIFPRRSRAQCRSTCVPQPARPPCAVASTPARDAKLAHPSN